MIPLRNARIGFPLAGPSWKFVLVQGVAHKESTHGWLEPPSNRLCVDFLNLKLGAYKALHYKSLAIENRGYDFFHVTAKRSDELPTWSGHSDTVACALALAQRVYSNDAPIVLISCNAELSANRSFAGAPLTHVADSRDPQKNRASLLQKLEAAKQSTVPVMAFILHRQDAKLLEQEGRGKLCRFTPLRDINWSQEVHLREHWPMLISVESGDLPLLACALGVDSQYFELDVGPSRHRTTGELCPFFGFKPIELNSLFYGRKQEQEELHEQFYNLVREHSGIPWMHVEGAPGIGKTSLIHAGLLGTLSETPGEFRTTVWRPGLWGRAPLAGLAHALGRVLYPIPASEILMYFNRGPDGLSQLLADWYNTTHERLVLFIDQLNEISSIPPKQIEQLARILDVILRIQERPLILITAGTTDTVNRLRSTPKLGSLFRETRRYFLRSMDASALEEAIRGSAQRGGLSWKDEQLPAQLAQDTIKSLGGLPALGHTLKILWRHRNARHLLRETYESLGGVDQAVITSADAVLSGMSNQDIQKTQRVLLALVRCKTGCADERKVLTWHELVNFIGGDENAEALLLHLATEAEGPRSVSSLSIISITHEANWALEERRVEIVHETLLHIWPKLRSWIDERRPLLEHCNEVESVAQRWVSLEPQPDPHDYLLEFFQGMELLPDHHSEISSLMSEPAQCFLTAIESAKLKHQEELSALQSSLSEERIKRNTVETNLQRSQQRVQSLETAIAQVQTTVQRVQGEQNSNNQSNSSTIAVKSGFKFWSFLVIGIFIGFAAGIGLMVLFVKVDEPRLKDGGSHDFVHRLDAGVPRDLGHVRLSPDAAPPKLPRRFLAGQEFSTKGGKMVLVLAAWQSLHAKSFLIDRTEVTVGAFRECYNDNWSCNVAYAKPSLRPQCNLDKKNRERHPMNCLNLSEAETFCKWADGKRLPTSEEWETAALGQDGRPYPWSSRTLLNQPCWRSYEGTCVVDSHSDDNSPFGAVDMAGNVQEWTSSPHPTAGYQIARGGAWSNGLPTFSPTIDMKYLIGKKPEGIESRGSVLGFRCAMDIPAQWGCSIACNPNSKKDCSLTCNDAK